MSAREVQGHRYYPCCDIEKCCEWNKPGLFILERYMTTSGWLTWNSLYGVWFLYLSDFGMKSSLALEECHFLTWLIQTFSQVVSTSYTSNSSNVNHSSLWFLPYYTSSSNSMILPCMSNTSSTQLKVGLEAENQAPEANTSSEEWLTLKLLVVRAFHLTDARSRPHLHCG